MKFPPEQEWIKQALQIAVTNLWQRAQHVAQSQLGDEALAQEIIEDAIEKAARRLQAGPHRGSEEVTLLLKRQFAQEVRRRRKANKRLVFVGSSQELASDSAQDSQTRLDSAMDLEVILHDVAPDVRFALLLRYSRSRWSEIAAVLGTSESAVRLRCKRALDRIRQKLEGEDRKT